jgi:hypothetical protein
MKLLIAFFLAYVLAVSACADEGKKLIWNQIPFVKAGNYLEFNAELSRTRAEARSELLGEFSALLLPLAYSTDDVVRLAQVLANTLVRFDGLVRQHGEEVHRGIPASLAEDFKAGLDQLVSEHRLNDNEQRTGLAYLDRDELRKLSSRKIPVEEARRVMHDIRFLAYGSYTIVGRRVVRAVLTLEDLLTSRVLNVSAQGPIGDVGGLLAARVFDILQGDEYPNWENPQPQLTWIAPAAPQSMVNAMLAARYCAGQKARLPYAEELMQAAMAGPYRTGGIGPLKNHAVYIVADKNRFDEQYYYGTGEEAQSQTGGPLYTGAGHGPLTGYYWCVRGAPSNETLFNQAVYRLIRQNLQVNRPEVVFALEYVLANTYDTNSDPLGHEVGKAQKQPSFQSLKGAIQFLAKNEIFLQVP